MKHQAAVSIVLLGAVALVGAPTQGMAEEQESVLTNPQVEAPAFPPSRACTKSSPCQNLPGEIIRVEEAYWIKTATGLERRLKVTEDTKMDSLVKKGDKIAAQVTSTGDAEAVVKLKELPQPRPEASLPSTTSEDIREQSSSGR
jgi:hypothetical protein